MTVELNENDQGWLETAAQLFREASTTTFDGRADLLWCAQRCDELACAVSGTRCTSTTGGGRYRCCHPEGHIGKHEAAGLYTTWRD